MKKPDDDRPPVPGSSSEENDHLGGRFKSIQLRQAMDDLRAATDRLKTDDQIHSDPPLEAAEKALNTVTDEDVQAATKFLDELNALTRASRSDARDHFTDAELEELGVDLSSLKTEPSQEGVAVVDESAEPPVVNAADVDRTIDFLDRRTQITTYLQAKEDHETASSHFSNVSDIFSAKKGDRDKSDKSEAEALFGLSEGDEE